MNETELRTLLTAEGLALIERVPAALSESDLPTLVKHLQREGYSPLLIQLALTQAKLRTKAQKKFGSFASNMLFTPAGLEQATRLNVAAQHAGRFQRANIQTLSDIGCGIGADSLAFGALGLHVRAVEQDSITSALAAYNLAPFRTVTVVHAQAETLHLEQDEALYFDPARRSAGHRETKRLHNPNEYSPNINWIFDLAQKHSTGIKLGPGFKHENIPDEVEAQWISHNATVVEMGLWSGALAQPGIKRSALILSENSVHELTHSRESPDAQLGTLQTYLYEPDGAIIRARLIGMLAETLNGRMISEGIAYITSETFYETPFASCFRIEEMFPLKETLLKKALHQRGIGILEIKKRGVDHDPALLRKRLGLRGNASATLILTRVAGKHCALLTKRMRTHTSQA